MLKNKKLLFFIILIIAIVLRFAYLDKGYNSDEGWLLKAASLDLKKLIPFLGEGRSVYPPLSPFLFHLWLRFNQGEVWVRSYFVIFGIALCVLVYHIGKLFIDAQFGMLAFFISALSALLIWSSQFIRSYIDSAFWVILSFYFMLRMLKGDVHLKNSLAYIISSVFAVYSSYLNILILASQSIFIFMFFIKDIRFLKRWLILQILISIIFIPCLLLLLKQAKLATAIDPQWSQRGFQIFGFNLGYYARSAAAIFGMDPDFLTARPLAKELNVTFLSVLAILSFYIITWVFIKAIKNIKSVFKEKRLIWFFPTASLAGLVLYVVLVEIKNFPFQPEYFIPQHVLFIFVIASAIYEPARRYRLNPALFFFVAFIFITRFPRAIGPEFDTKMAYRHLLNNFEKDECLLMVRNTSRYIDAKRFNTIIMYGYLKKNSDADYYQPLNDMAIMKLCDIKEKYKKIWFYRLYGNDEILGANNQIIGWFKDNGYVVKDIQRFKRIDLMRYERIN
jgi:hypothetical protein